MSLAVRGQRRSFSIAERRFLHRCSKDRRGVGGWLWLGACPADRDLTSAADLLMQTVVEKIVSIAANNAAENLSSVRDFRDFTPNPKMLELIDSSDLTVILIG